MAWFMLPVGALGLFTRISRLLFKKDDWNFIIFTNEHLLFIWSIGLSAKNIYVYFFILRFREFNWYLFFGLYIFFKSIMNKYAILQLQMGVLTWNINEKMRNFNITIAYNYFLGNNSPGSWEASSERYPPPSWIWLQAG